MKKRSLICLLPSILLPYAILFSVLTLLYSSRILFAQWMMEHLFYDNVWMLGLVLLIWVFVAAALNIGVSIVGIRSNWDAKALAKTSMMIKLIQIPAYIGIFVFGVMFLLTIFTFPITVALVLLDGVTLLLTGLLTAASSINAARANTIPVHKSVLYIALQCVFVVDIVSTIVLYVQLKQSR